MGFVKAFGFAAPPQITTPIMLAMGLLTNRNHQSIK